MALSWFINRFPTSSPEKLYWPKFLWCCWQTWGNSHKYWPRWLPHFWPFCSGNFRKVWNHNFGSSYKIWYFFHFNVLCIRSSYEPMMYWNTPQYFIVCFEERFLIYKNMENHWYPRKLWWKHVCLIVGTVICTDWTSRWLDAKEM